MVGLEHDGPLQGPGHFEEQGKGKNERKRGRKEKPFSSFFFSSTLRSPHSSSHTHTFISPMKSMEPMERKLMSSAAAGSVLAVTSLLKDNPDLHANCKDIDGRSPLHLASEWGNLGVVHLLLTHLASRSIH